MSFFKYLTRVETMHQMIQVEKTGPSQEFARRIGVSRSVLMDHIREMREELKAPIDYCRRRETFYYTKPFTFNIVISENLEKVKGGKNYTKNISESERTGLYSINFDHASTIEILYEEAKNRL